MKNILVDGDKQAFTIEENLITEKEKKITLLIGSSRIWISIGNRTKKKVL